MYFEVASVSVSLGTQVQPQKILVPDYRPGYLCVSYDYVSKYSRLSFSVHLIKHSLKTIAKDTFFLLVIKAI